MNAFGIESAAEENEPEVTYKDIDKLKEMKLSMEEKRLARWEWPNACHC